MQTKYWNKAKVLMTVLGVGSSLTTSYANTYPAPDYTGPATRPTFPTEFPAFNPPVTNVAVSAGSPDLAEWTRSNKPGDTMMLTGSRLTSLGGGEAGTDSQFYFSDKLILSRPKPSD
jgi:hypothetical protein